MSYTAIYDAATGESAILRKQVTVAIVKAATDMLNDPGQSEPRRSWSAEVIAVPGAAKGIAKSAMWKVLENATILAAPDTATDSDVQFVVNSIIDFLLSLRIIPASE